MLMLMPTLPTPAALLLVVRPLQRLLMKCWRRRPADRSGRVAAALGYRYDYCYCGRLPEDGRRCRRPSMSPPTTIGTTPTADGAGWRARGRTA